MMGIKSKLRKGLGFLLYSSYLIHKLEYLLPLTDADRCKQV